MLRRRLLRLLAAAAVLVGVAVPTATADAQDCTCATTANTDASVLFTGTAVGRVGDVLEGPILLDEWSFVVTDVYRGDTKVEQFVATASEGCDRIAFERDQTYVVFGEPIPKDELPATILPLSVIRADACATTVDQQIISELGLVPLVPDAPVEAIAGAGRLRPASDDDKLDPLTALVFAGGFLVTTWAVFWLWRRPLSTELPPS